MSSLRVVVVDDEQLAREELCYQLEQLGEIEVVGQAGNGLEAMAAIDQKAPDLVFLDIQMPELDGFAVLRQLDPARWPLVIFVTAYDTFALQAFDTHAVDYLVKPVQETRFCRAMDRARERLRAREARAHSLTSPPRRLVLGVGGSDVILDVADIEWIEADDYYAAVHARGGRHLVRESLASLEERLDRAQFVRVHRSAIVNLARVRQIRHAAIGDAVVVLDSGMQLPLSRRRREHVAEAIRRFAG